jgi:phosphoribosylglycinamide formyltransferase-1
MPSDDLKGWHYDQNIVTILQEHGVTPQSGLVCLAGFMRIISPEFVRQYRMRIMNIHPALLPAFPGLHAQKQALDYGVKVSGCTVHFVDEGMDSGPVILQKAVPVVEGDNEECLSARILEQEHELYPEAVRLFCEGRIKIEGRRVSII